MRTLEQIFGPLMLDELERLIDARAEAIADRKLAEHVAQTEVRWISTGQAARLLGVSADAVRMRVNRGTLVGRRRGRRIEIDASSARGCQT